MAWAGRGVLIVGPPGAGKSALALQLMAFGAGLVADDRTRLSVPDDGPPLAAAAPNIAGRIEARGVGILAADPAPPCRLALVVDLAEVERERLPPPRTVRLMGRDLPLLHKVESPHFGPAILQYLKGDRP